MFFLSCVVMMSLEMYYEIRIYRSRLFGRHLRDFVTSGQRSVSLIKKKSPLSSPIICKKLNKVYLVTGRADRGEVSIMPMVDRNETCDSFLFNGGMSECVALWTHTDGKLVTRESDRRKRRSYENPVGNERVTVNPV